ncbi:MAG: RES family NAD+ phosphorylase [Chitinophagaceae bacterium]|nr:RES family NAD+ phosphorylase [Chitinophagaceae bacterium]
MEVYRIAQEKYATDLSGNGAKLYGGRWNSEGIFALYTSSSRSLALLATLAHTNAALLAEKIYLLVTLSIPTSLKPEIIALDKLPSDWDSRDQLTGTQRAGDLFLQKQKSLLLAVPSVLMPEEFNYVLNPLHPDMRKLKITHQRRMRFDKRAIGHL